MRQRKLGRISLEILLLSLVVALAAVKPLQAQEKLVVAYPAGAGTHGPLWAASDLGLFEKYGLHVDTVMISGSVRGIQSLLSNSTHIIQGDPTPPILAAARGADLAIFGQPLNRSPFTFLSSKQIRKPSDLVGKKIGILNFSDATDINVSAALKEWNIPRRSVTIVPMGSDWTVRLIALANGSIDATVMAPPDSFVAAARYGLTVLAEMSDLKISFPHTVLTTTRPFIKRNPEMIKRFIQAYSEAIFQFSTDKAKGLAVYNKHLRQRDPKVIQQTYDYYGPRFSLPPTPDAAAIGTVLDLMGQHAPEGLDRIDVAQFVDDSAVRALEKEGFFKKLMSRANK